MGTLCEAAYSREFASRWQIVASRRLSALDHIQVDSAHSCSFSKLYRIFPSLGRKARLSGTVVYASQNRRIGREARPARRIAYTTFG
jgi:hypothetical protein